MKKNYFTILLAFLFVGAMSAQVIQNPEVEDDYDFYTLGDISSQNTWWRTWSGVEGGAEDGDVVDVLSQSGTQSLNIDGSGIMDQLLRIDSEPATGLYLIEWAMYVPAGKGAYFNMQAAGVPEGDAWVQALMGGNVYFNCGGADAGHGIVTGTIDCSFDPGVDSEFTFPHDEWFKVTAIYDNDAQTWGMKVNDVLQFEDHTYAFGAQVFAGVSAIDFFSADTNNEYYVDDTYAGEGVLGLADIQAKGFSAYPNPVQNRLNLNALETITSVSIYNVLGQEIYSANVDALNTTIDTSSFASGAYFVRVNVSGTEGTVKILK